MPRFSKKVKKIFDLIWYKGDIEQSKLIFKELASPLDMAFAKIWLAYYYFLFLKPNLALTELEKSEEMNLSNLDPLNSFFINSLYFYYYAGWSSPTVSLELAKNYFNNFESLYNSRIEYFDEWEKYLCEGMYYTDKGFYNGLFEHNFEQGIMLLKKAKETYRLIPEDGEYFSRFVSSANLGILQRFAGHFDESEKNLQIASQEAEKHNNLWQIIPLFHLQWLSVQKGEIKKAMELNDKAYGISKKFNYIIGIYGNLGIRGDLFNKDGKYDEALDSYQESLIYRKQHKDPLEICKGYMDIFFLYYQNFRLNKEKENFKKAEELLLQIKKLHEQHPDDKTITNYTNYSEARVLKFGNFNKRAKASMMFEELMKIWPDNFDIVKEYLDLLFEDYSISEDQETMEKIDFLMKKVIELPLSINSIRSFVSQQIMLARYQFFIKDDIGSAFEILNEAKEKISPFKIHRYNSQLEHELMNFKNERTKWEKADYSVKERIEKSEFKKYIQEALKTKIS